MRKFTIILLIQILSLIGIMGSSAANFNGLSKDIMSVHYSPTQSNIASSRELLQFGGGGFGGALLTTGSFTMMAASGGF